MFSAEIRDSALSRRNAVLDGAAEHNRTLNIEAGVGPVVVSDVLIANLATSRVVDDPDAWTSGRRPCFPARGGAGACGILASADRSVGQKR